jgi:homocysteine S-methyltransferase
VTTTTRSGFAARLAQGTLVLDGGLATELERRGHELSDRLWSARLLRDAPEDIEAVHRAYFEAGADVAISASYQATYEGFAAAGVDAAETTRLLRLSVELARRARDAVRPDGLVAASVGPYAVVLADRSEYSGDYGDATAEEIAAVHRPRIAALLDAGPDVLALETIPSIREVAALAELLAEFPGAAAWMTFCCRDGERLSDGTPVEQAARIAAAGGVAALGVNCTAPQFVASLLERIRGSTELPLLAYPNAGDGLAAGGELPAPLVARWRACGARGIGGCCGTGPDAIAGIAALLHA